MMVQAKVLRTFATAGKRYIAGETHDLPAARVSGLEARGFVATEGGEGKRKAKPQETKPEGPSETKPDGPQETKDMPHICGDCREQFDTRRGLTVHQSAMHK